MTLDAPTSFTEETLDPTDWNKLRALGHRMLDSAFDYTENIRSQRTLPLTAQAIEDICVPLSEDGEGEEKVYDIYQRSILPYTLALAPPSCGVPWLGRDPRMACWRRCCGRE